MSQDTTKQAKFRPDFSPTVTWPVIFEQLQEDGPAREWKIPMRWHRPTQKDCDDFRKRQERAAQARIEYLQAAQKDAEKAVKDGATAIDFDAVSAGAEAASLAVFNPDAELARWWKGWPRDAIEGELDPDSDADRASLLDIRGMRAAMHEALQMLMAGARQKNWQTPPGR